MKYSFSWFFLLLPLSFSVSARLNIEITQGMVGGVPIGVVSQEQTGGGAHSVSFEELANVIRNDLKMSARFEPLYPEQIPKSTMEPQSFNSAAWQKMGVENMVLGTVEPLSQGRFKVSFQLVDIFRKNAILLSKTFDNIPREDFRALAHHMSDLIYEKLTGVRGAFSTRIAYIMVVNTPNGKRYSLEVADADGYNPISLVNAKEPIMSPSWSPDGRHIAYVSFESKRAEVMLLEVATGKKSSLSKFPGINGAPVWSPDQSQLALVLSKDGAPKIYLLDLITRQLKQLTKGYSIDTEPVWSNDGRALYFTSNRGGKPQIYRVNLANEKIDRITFVGDYNARPKLTPDGKYLVMMHRSNNKGQFHIANQELTTGQVSVLTHSSLDESPTLSPNGAMILYGTKNGGRQILGLVTLDGRGQIRLPAREGSVQEPAWSPFLS